MATTQVWHISHLFMEPMILIVFFSCDGDSTMFGLGDTSSS
jgi:hypothetical protein